MFINYNEINILLNNHMEYDIMQKYLFNLINKLSKNKKLLIQKADELEFKIDFLIKNLIN